MIVEVLVVRLRVRVCRCGFWCDDNFLPDDEFPDRWVDHVLEHADAACVFRWRGAFETTLKPPTCPAEALTVRSHPIGT